MVCPRNGLSVVSVTMQYIFPVNLSAQTRLRFLTMVVMLLTSLSVSAANSVTVREGTNFAVDAGPTVAEEDTRTLVMDLQGMLWLLPENGGKAKRLTGPEDDIRLPRFSPDGSQLLFQSFRDGAWQLATTDADGNNRRDLTVGIDDYRDPAWSPAGGMIYFTSDRSGNYEIWSLNLVTRTFTQLTDEPADDYAPAVAANGDIAFVSDRSGKAEIYLLSQTQITSSDENSAGAKLLYSAPAKKLDGLRFSPDGKQLAFTQVRERIAFPGIECIELAILELATSKLNIVSGDEDVFPLPPAWLDADTLIYTADGLIRKHSLANAETTSVQFKARLNVSEAPQFEADIATFRQGSQPVKGIVNPVATPAGNQLIFEALGDLWARNQDGSLGQLTDDSFVQRDPTISTDGRWLAYISDRSGEMQVWMRDAGAGTDTQITTKSSGPRYPTFNKDGTWLAWQEVGPIGTQDFTLHVLDLLSGKRQRLKHAPPIWPGPMSWSADGEFITVAKLHSTSSRFRDGRNLLVRVAVNDDSTFNNILPDNLVADFGPASSADGIQTALVIDGALHVVPTATDGSFTGRPVMVLDALAEFPSWSNAGKVITYLSATGLAQLDLSTGVSTALAVDLDWKNTHPRGRTIVHAGRLYNGMSRNYRSNVDIEIDNGRIVAVKRHRPHPDKVRVIDASDQSVLPGLIDQHGHFQPHQGEWVGRAWLAFGATTVVEPGGIPWQSRALMESWGSGRQPGPRLVFSGPHLDGYRRSFHFGSHINSDKRLDWELERADYLNYGLLKTYVRMPAARQARTIELAHARNIPVTAHSAFRTLAFGGDRIEHLRGGSRYGHSAKQSAAQKTYADVRNLLSANESAITPTIAVGGGFFSYMLANPELAENRQFVALYPEAYRKGLTGFARMMGKNEQLLAYGYNNALASIAEMHDADVRIVAGTDSPIFPYGMALIVELTNYQAAGLAPWEVLETATSSAAEAMGVADQIGSIRKGRLADLVIVDGDPLSDVSDLFNVTGVMRNGNYYTLEELLE